MISAYQLKPWTSSCHSHGYQEVGWIAPPMLPAWLSAVVRKTRLVPKFIVMPVSFSLRLISLRIGEAADVLRGLRENQAIAFYCVPGVVKPTPSSAFITLPPTAISWDSQNWQHYQTLGLCK